MLVRSDALKKDMFRLSITTQSVETEMLDEQTESKDSERSRRTEDLRNSKRSDELTLRDGLFNRNLWKNHVFDGIEMLTCVVDFAR